MQVWFIPKARPQQMSVCLRSQFREASVATTGSVFVSPRSSALPGDMLNPGTCIVRKWFSSGSAAFGLAYSAAPFSGSSLVSSATPQPDVFETSCQHPLSHGKPFGDNPARHNTPCALQVLYQTLLAATTKASTRRREWDFSHCSSLQALTKHRDVGK